MRKEVITRENIRAIAKASGKASRISRSTPLPVGDAVGMVPSRDTAAIGGGEAGCPYNLFNSPVMNVELDHTVRIVEAIMIGTG